MPYSLCANSPTGYPYFFNKKPATTPPVSISDATSLVFLPSVFPSIKSSVAGCRMRLATVPTVSCGALLELKAPASMCVAS